MSEQSHDISHIDLYLSGGLSQADSLAFEKSLEEDPALKASVREVLRAKTTAYLAGRDAWKERMNRRFDESPRSNSFLPKYALVAAAILLGVFVGIWLFQTPVSLEASGKIFHAYYEVPPAPEIRDMQDSSRLTRGFVAYNSRDFQAALLDFDLLISEAGIDTDRSKLLFFKGISLIELGREQEAIDALKQIESGQYVQGAEFMRALLQTKMGEYDQASILLQRLTGSSNAYSSKAKQILDELKQNPQ